jgi:hypothetical protein
VEWGEWVVTGLVLFLARVLGWVLGVRSVERGRTPVGLWEEWERKGI